MNEWNNLEELHKRIVKKNIGIKKIKESLDIVIDTMRDYLLNTEKSDRCILFQSDAILRGVIDVYSEKFNSIIGLYNTGNTFDTYRALCDLIKGDLDDFITKLEPLNILYRMRPSEEYMNLERKDLFHNPFNKLENISKQRYSIDGFPCLYLGSSLYDCWMETRCPDIWKVNFAAFRNQKGLYFFNVDFPSKIEKEGHFLQIILFCLCSIKVSDDKKKHKFEYIFPELLLHSIISIMNDNHPPACSHKISGIKYLSSFYYDSNDFYQNKQILYNYVIPVKAVDSSAIFCPVLKDIFKVSEVNALYKYKLRSISFTKNKTRANLYKESLFSQIERTLIDFEFIQD